jgi:hypothetical protein
MCNRRRLARPIRGAKPGSQQRQEWSDSGRRRATIDTARWRIRLRAATTRDGKVAPEKRKVGGSTPPLTTTTTSDHRFAA